jgi:hypothetical protein
VRIYDGRGNTTDAKTLLRTCNAHSHPVTAMKYACIIVLPASHFCNIIRMHTSAPHNAVVSTDAAGMLEIWDPTTLALPHSVTFKFKSDTGLYDLAKSKTLGKSIEVLRRSAAAESLFHPPQVSPTGEMFSVVTSSKKVLVYRVATGRRCAEIDESLEIVHESQKHSNVSVLHAACTRTTPSWRRHFT